MRGLGFPTVVMVRSKILRGFDRGMVSLIQDEMENRGVKFIHNTTPNSVTKLPDGKLLVQWKNENVC